MFMPVLLGTLLHIPVHILSENIKLFQPLHEMTREGAPAKDSLLLNNNVNPATAGTDNTVDGNLDANGLCASRPTKARLPVALSNVERCLFLVFLSGLIILIVYYHNVDRASSFEDFMDGETFGVKFLFTLIGTVIASLWWSFFETIAIISPYHRLASSANITSAASLAVSRPTNTFSGLRASMKHRDPFLAAVSLIAMAAEFLPIFLAKVPFNMSELQAVYEFSYWVALCIVCVMVLLIAASFLIRWTRLRADPSTLAGAISIAMDGNILG